MFRSMILPVLAAHKTIAAVTTLALTAGTGLALTAGVPAQQGQRPAKNVIIFVGDGMGASHRGLIRYGNVGPEGTLAMDAMPVSGLSHTFPHDPDNFVTDSAAGGDRVGHRGQKTYNGAIGVDEHGDRVQSVLELAGAERQGHRAGHHRPGHRRDTARPSEPMSSTGASRDLIAKPVPRNEQASR